MKLEVSEFAQQQSQEMTFQREQGPLLETLAIFVALKSEVQEYYR
jgi:hypothetical protein